VKPAQQRIELLACSSRLPAHLPTIDGKKTDGRALPITGPAVQRTLAIPMAYGSTSSNNQQLGWRVERARPTPGLSCWNPCLSAMNPDPGSARHRPGPFQLAPSRLGQITP